MSKKKKQPPRKSLNRPLDDVSYQGRRTKQHLARCAITTSKRRQPLTKTLGLKFVDRKEYLAQCDSSSAVDVTLLCVSMICTQKAKAEGFKAMYDVHKP